MFYEPLPKPLTNISFFIFFFFRHFFFFFGGSGYSGLKRPKIPGEKTHTLVNGWVGAHVTHVLNCRGLSPKNGVDIWTSVRKTCVICVLACNYLVSAWDPKVKYDLILAPKGSQIFECLREFFTDMPWSTCNRLVQRKKKAFLRKRKKKLSYGNAWPLLSFFEACGRGPGGTHFRP